MCKCFQRPQIAFTLGARERYYWYYRLVAWNIRETQHWMMDQVSGGSKGNVPHGPPDHYYYYFTILEYLVICCWPRSIDTFDFIFGCFFGYFCCCFSEILRYAYFVLLLIHSILRNKMRNVKYTCLMKDFIIWSAVLCNDFELWEKP